jgi:hypothetical protein
MGNNEGRDEIAVQELARQYYRPETRKECFISYINNNPRIPLLKFLYS